MQAAVATVLIKLAQHSALHLHGLQEHNTSAYIRKTLDDLGVAYKCGPLAAADHVAQWV